MGFIWGEFFCEIWDRFETIKQHTNGEIDGFTLEDMKKWRIMSLFDRWRGYMGNT